MARRRSSSKHKSGLRKGTETTGATATPVSPPLHCEDAALWAEVTKSLTPLKSDHDRLHFGPLLDEKPSLPSQWNPAHQNAALQGKGRAGVPSQKSVPKQGGHGHNPASVFQALPDLGGFSRREMRQISSGRQSIEARLDLHGLRQNAAHVALKGFLVQSQARGFRHVLVITGKGRSNPRDDLMFAGPEQGVLRRVVPLWLAESDLRLIIAGFSEAPQRHGGEGALYVRLRRNR